MSNKVKQIIICADDYGLNPAVSQGIRDLVKMNRLSAVSCMVKLPHFAEEANALLDLNPTIQLGLHFSLPDKLPLLLLKSHLGLIFKNRIRQEIETQINLFINYFKRQPDFIDGHLHIHQFPKIRECLLDVYQQRFPSNNVMIRSTYPIIRTPRHRFKAWVLSILGGKALQKKLTQLGIPHNSAFAGIYHFHPETNYQNLFQTWLGNAPHGALIMCHPGIWSEKHYHYDHVLCRQHEWEYLISDAFLQDLQEHESKLACSSII